MHSTHTCCLLPSSSYHSHPLTLVYGPLYTLLLLPPPILSPTNPLHSAALVISSDLEILVVLAQPTSRPRSLSLSLHDITYVLRPIVFFFPLVFFASSLYTLIFSRGRNALSILSISVCVRGFGC